MSCECADKWGANHVDGEGSIPSRVMAIAEAPGEDEDRERRPFVGGSGRVLGRWLYESGVFRREMYIDNVFQHRPPNNEVPQQADYLRAHQSLEQRIAKVNPRVIIAFGETALNFFGKEGIGNWRGTLFTWKGIRVVPVFHPAFIMRVPTMWNTCVEDLKFAFHKAEHWEIPELDYKINPPEGWFTAWVNELDPRCEVSIDLETAYGDIDELEDEEIPITQVALSVEPHKAICIDLEEHYMRPLLRLLGAPHEWTGQNIIMFDAPVIRTQLGPDIRVAHDTMLYHHLLHSPSRHNLSIINSRYTRYPYWKDQIKTHRHKYACTDADVTLQVRRMMSAQLEAQGMTELARVVIKAAHYVRKMKERGVPVDVSLVGEAQKALETDANEVLEKLRALTGDKWFNPRSSKQCAEFLYDKLMLPRQYNRKGRKATLTTDDDALVKLSSRHEAPKLILAYRRPANDLSKYFRTDTIHNGRWHPNWRVHGTETGRYACWFHTLPPRVRHVVRQQGKRIAYVDAQQGEFRIAVSRYCADDKVGQAVVESEYGVHVANAIRIYSRLRGYKVAPTEVTPMMRFYAKFTTFGWLYGREAPSISEQYGVPLAGAQEIVNELNNEYKATAIWKADTASFGLRHGWLRNPFTRKREFPEGTPSDKEREMYAFIPQSTLHDIIQRAHILTEEAFPSDTCEVVGDMHDALLSVVAYTFQREDILSLLNREYLPGLYMPFDCDLHDYWFDKRAEEDAKGKVIIQ